MDLHNLKLKLHDHFPIIVIETHDEQRVVDLLKMATSQDAELGQLKIWNASHGLDLKTKSSPSDWRVEGIDTDYQEPDTNELTDPTEMLKAVKPQAKNCIILLPYFHSYLNNPPPFV